ncbi:MAG: acylneuraminate cytidylyltransferase family protein [Alphaproteobacteria bacterium]|nr:acylneuraminate cytidylyltransferase family protein [Alphaproteobacteria bacterium]
MINGRSVLAVIAARGGSKGLPRKNVLDVAGRPMIAWSVEAARNSTLIDRAIVSTDDEEIATAARAAGGEVPFLRPPALATDTISVYDALFHASDTIGGHWDYLVLLQATSPLRTAADIDGCIRACSDAQAPAALSVTQSPKPPEWMVRLDGDGRMQPLLAPDDRNRRQDFVPTYIPNGAVYVAELEWLRRTRIFMSAETRAFVMPPERSVDVDTMLDLVAARHLAGAGENK